MGPDRAPDRECRNGADAGISELCPPTASARRNGLRNRIGISAGAATRAFLQEPLLALRQYRGDSAAGSRLSVQRRWVRRGRQPAQWKWLRQPPEHFAFERSEDRR